jgi:hypothetical protein
VAVVVVEPEHVIMVITRVFLQATRAVMAVMAAVMAVRVGDDTPELHVIVVLPELPLILPVLLGAVVVEVVLHVATGDMLPGVVAVVVEALQEILVVPETPGALLDRLLLTTVYPLIPGVHTQLLLVGLLGGK